MHTDPCVGSKSCATLRNSLPLRCVPSRAVGVFRHSCGSFVPQQREGKCSSCIMSATSPPASVSITLGVCVTRACRRGLAPAFLIPRVLMGSRRATGNPGASSMGRRRAVLAQCQRGVSCDTSSRRPHVAAAASSALRRALVATGHSQGHAEPPDIRPGQAGGSECQSPRRAWREAGALLAAGALQVPPTLTCRTPASCFYSTFRAVCSEAPRRCSTERDAYKMLTAGKLLRAWKMGVPPPANQVGHDRRAVQSSNFMHITASEPARLLHLRSPT